MEKMSRRLKEAWAIGTDNTALVVVDMQRAFVDEGAPVEITGARELVPRINELAAQCRKLEIPVIFIKATRRTDLADMGLLRDMTTRDWDNEMDTGEGKKGTEFCPGLDVTPNDYIVPKVRFSALIPGSSTLEPLLRGLGRDCIIICGVATDVCVGTTTMDAMMLGFKVFFVGDLTVTRNEQRQKAALELYNSLFAKVMTFDEVRKELMRLH